MSFIAGYILGCGDVGDRRVKMLDRLDHLYKLDIGEGWNIRIKIADDIDNAQFFNFASNHGGIGDYITMWSLYYCVYLNDEFKYATCENPFYKKYQENYQYSDTPDRLYSITRISGFRVTSAAVKLGSGGTSLTVNIEGTFTESKTYYSWTNDTDRIEGETVDSTSIFSRSKDDFYGSQYHGYYIVNGDADDFRDHVCGLYGACRARAQAEKN